MFVRLVVYCDFELIRGNLYSVDLVNCCSELEVFLRLVFFLIGWFDLILIIYYEILMGMFLDDKWILWLLYSVV